MRKLVLTLMMGLFTGVLMAQSPTMIRFTELQELIEDSPSQLTVVNFWATWCGPCIKELPYFEEADKLKNVRVMLVSLDFPEEAEKVGRFLAKKKLQSSVYLLNEKDYDSYMGKVHEAWTGAIPATLLVSRDGNKSFYERAFTREELLSEINRHIDN